MKKILLLMYNRSSVEEDFTISTLEFFLKREGIDSIVSNSIDDIDKRYDLVGVIFKNSEIYVESVKLEDSKIKRNHVDPLIELQNMFPNQRFVGLYDFEKPVRIARKNGLLAYKFPDFEMEKTINEIVETIYQQ